MAEQLRLTAHFRTASDFFESSEPIPTFAVLLKSQLLTPKAFPNITVFRMFSTVVPMFLYVAGSVPCAYFQRLVWVSAKG